MPFPTAALLGIQAGSSIFSSLLGRKKKQTSTSTNTPTLTPEQQNIHSRLGQTIGQRLDSPGLPIDVSGSRNRLRTGVNRNYDSVLKRIEAGNTRRGYGRGGVTGSAARGVEVARANAMGDLESRFQEYINSMEIQERNRTLEQALSFARPYGSQQQGQTSYQDPSAGFESLGGDLGFLLTLSSILKPGGGLGGGGMPDLPQEHLSGFPGFRG